MGIGGIQEHQKNLNFAHIARVNIGNKSDKKINEHTRTTENKEK